MLHTTVLNNHRVTIMARGGISKVLVQEARQNLLSRGENPSIDAVRVELGNTGSKTTIHRYLKELEEAEATRLDDEALLSQPIKELIGRLAAKLTEEAHAIVESNEQASQQRINHLLEKLKQKERDNTYISEQLTSANSEIEALTTELEQTKSSNGAMEAQLNQNATELSRLNTALKEKQQQIESLEEKHQHNREALQHYRDSVKEQREQDIRQHEQQVQGLQIEIRNLNQTLSIKQTDITQLNKDNARLVTELSQVGKKVNDQESKIAASNTTIKQLEQEKERVTKTTKEMSTFQQQLDEAKQQVHELTIVNAKLESEIQVKSDLLRQFLEENIGQKLAN